MPLVEDCSSTAAVPRYRQASRVTSRNDDAILASESGTFSSLPTKNASRTRVRSTSIILTNGLRQSLADSVLLRLCVVLRALPSNVNRKWLSSHQPRVVWNGPPEVMSFDVIVASKLACPSRRRSSNPVALLIELLFGSRRTTPLPRHRFLGSISGAGSHPRVGCGRSPPPLEGGTTRLVVRRGPSRNASSCAVFARFSMLFTCDSLEASNACISASP